jgi:hypothetical protein
MSGRKRSRKPASGGGGGTRPRRAFRRRVLLAVVALVVAASFLARRMGVGPGGAPAFDASLFEEGPQVSALEAAAYVGQDAVVCGRVVNTVFAQATRGQPTYLNLERAFPEQPFDVVVWGRDRSRFDTQPEVLYFGHEICAAGRVTSHQDVPRIEARGPGQIRF